MAGREHALGDDATEDPQLAVATALALVGEEGKRIVIDSRGERACQRLEGSRVVVEVVDERWAKEIAGLSELLRARLDAAVGDIKEVVVRRVPMRSASAGSRGVAPKSTVVALQPVALGPDSAVEAISDVELRELARRVAQGYLARRKERDKAS